MIAPTITTERLVLRAHCPRDLDDCHAMWSDPIVTRNVGGRPFTREEVWSKLLRYSGHWSWLGFGYWVVRERATDAFVGEVGFANFCRDIEPPFGDVGEGGWVLASWAHGRGFATESVTAALDWYDRATGAARTVCLIDDANGASMRVASKCGYRPFARTNYKGTPVTLFERLR